MENIALSKPRKKKTKKKEIKVSLLMWAIILCVFIVCFFVYSVIFWRKAQSTGGMIGEGTGIIVGRALGSAEGLSKGQIAGYEAGKAEGLSAKDTSVELAGKIKKVEKLEVLVASGTFSDILKIPEEKPSYAALLSMRYNAVFTVDLGNADIALIDNSLHITLDQPVVDFIPVGAIEKKNEYQKPGFIIQPGSAQEGYIAADNSMNRMKQKAQEKLQQDESLISAAKASAETQVTQLVNAVSFTKPAVIIEYRKGEDNGPTI